MLCVLFPSMLTCTQIFRIVKKTLYLIASVYVFQLDRVKCHVLQYNIIIFIPNYL